MKRSGDGSGLLRPLEFDAALSRIDTGLTALEQQAFINSFRRDGRGRIDYRDLKAVLVDCRDMQRASVGRQQPISRETRRRAYRSERSIMVQAVGGPNPENQSALAQHRSLAYGERQRLTRDGAAQDERRSGAAQPAACDAARQ